MGNCSYCLILSARCTFCGAERRAQALNGQLLIFLDFGAKVYVLRRRTYPWDYGCENTARVGYIHLAGTPRGIGSTALCCVGYLRLAGDPRGAGSTALRGVDCVPLAGHPRGVFYTGL